MTIASNLGFPRIGARRELKFALERFWAGASDEAALQADGGSAPRARIGDLQQGSGIATCRATISRSTTTCSTPPACWAPSRPAMAGRTGPVSLDTYFALARAATKSGLTALEMTKWFDTNYHYLVPVLAGAISASR